MQAKFRRMIIVLLLIFCLSTQALALPETLVPVGQTVGIHLCGELVVVGFDESTGAGAKSAGVQIGDRIVAINGAQVNSLEELRGASDDDGVHLTVERNGKQVEFYLSPVQTPEGGRIGLKVRDGITGVGTVTFYDPVTGSYGALGHSVNDPETGACIPITGGSLMAASVTEVIRGKPGNPGELRGSFTKDNTLGDIQTNSPVGIFGTMCKPALCEKPLPLAAASQVQETKAQILSNVNGSEVASYQVEILKIDMDNRSGRNFLLQVDDDALLEKTGGIVQGMSGSPIIQDGRLIGAVTHVLVDNPRMGYGIFIENMLEADQAA